MRSPRQLDHEIDEFLGGSRRPWHGSKVQSLLFARPRWSPNEARAWAQSHGYRSYKVHETDDYVRLRQFSPTKGSQKRTITFGDGIKAIVEQVK